jgi:tagatose 1,6-diphosphate aldolase GatY/KbaY
VLCTNLDQLRRARREGYAVPAINTQGGNYDIIMAICKAAEALKSPVILAHYVSTGAYSGHDWFYQVAKWCAQKVSVPVSIHLDHGSDFEICMEALRLGFTSLMIDGSTLPFDGNVTLTRQVVEMASGLPVEAELGTVGGKEDTHEAQAQYTDPDEAAEFVRLTGITSFAVAIGTAHGVYKGEPKLDLNRLSEVRARVDIPLVLHGTSGVPEDQVRECIRRGICKVNYATELRMVFTAGVKKAMEENPSAFDPKKYLGPGRKAVMERVRELIRLCGSDGKA